MDIKKRGFFLLSIIVLMVNIYNVNAYLGLTPALIKTDFEPEMKFFVNFNVLGAGAEQNLSVYAAGDLAEYVSFDKINITGGEGFTAYVTLPKNVSKPGKNNLFIRIGEMKNVNEGIGTRLEIGALISIKVPYPGKYAEITNFNADEVNEGDAVGFSANVESLGTEDISASANLKVYSDNKLMDNFDLGTKLMKPKTSELFEKKVEAGHYKAGLYNASIEVDYGDYKRILKSEKTFRVGSLLVEIINWTSEFNKSKINPFEIEVESKWNNNLDNIYAEINVSDNEGKQIDFFKTPSSELRKWEKIKLKGFFNAENAEEGEYNAKIALFYSQKTTEKIVKIKIVSPAADNTLIIVISAAIALLIIVFAIIFYFLLKKKKVSKKR
jgi:hypothetical protein